ncbi:uncharacterized protein LOC112434847 [Maylandia zebra]|uniref:uncharacterized protein LOC112434847 n=1 Tax=Maylandia zebra TaxID=106582 RepID=UPI00403D1192
MAGGIGSMGGGMDMDLDEEMPQQGSEAMHSSSVQDFEETETSQIQKTVSCLKPQPNSFPNNDLDLKHPEPERDLDEEMPQQGSEAMHSSSVQDFEETETSQIQKTVSCLKPQPNSFPNNDLDLKHPEPERDLDEEMPQQGSEAMHSSSVQDFEETETSQIQKTVSCLKPQPNSFPNNDLDLKHPEPERDLDEEMPQQGSEAMHSSSVQDFEETETSQIQKTVSCLKPQPNSFPNNDLDLKHPEPERDLDEEMPQQGSEAMHSSSVQDFEETETSQIQKTVSCLKPQPNSFPNNDLDLKHPEPERDLDEEMPQQGSEAMHSSSVQDFEEATLT